MLSRSSWTLVVVILRRSSVSSLDLSSVSEADRPGGQLRAWEDLDAFGEDVAATYTNVVADHGPAAHDHAVLEVRARRDDAVAHVATRADRHAVEDHRPLHPRPGAHG